MDGFRSIFKYVPILAPIHIGLIQIAEKSELILSLPDVLQCTPPFANGSLLFVSAIQLQALFHLKQAKSSRNAEIRIRLAE